LIKLFLDPIKILNILIKPFFSVYFKYRILKVYKIEMSLSFKIIEFLITNKASINKNCINK